ncbi:MAG: hypothetical protein C5B49_11525 [Bdellovibrio sp.]|nr:MAG: hypothetical protein C5B49_11525 [Bdellovibrio sp.]
MRPALVCVIWAHHNLEIQEGLSNIPLVVDMSVHIFSIDRVSAVQTCPWFHVTFFEPSGCGLQQELGTAGVFRR